MITYSSSNASRMEALTIQMREKTIGYKPYIHGKPEISYRNQPNSFAVDMTPLYDPNRSPEEVIIHGPSKDAKIMLSTRTDNHEKGGITGYIDLLYGEEPFYPVPHTIEKEFIEECNFTAGSFALAHFRVGDITVHPRSANPDHSITVVNGLVLLRDQLVVVPNIAEILDCEWIDMASISEVENLKPGYQTITLPAALGGIGIGAH